MHNPRLPGGRGDGREFPWQAIRCALAAGSTEGISQCGHLSRLQSHGALREPADADAERLLSQFHAAAVIGRVDENDEEPFGF